MDELIKIQKTSDGKQAVSARELHSFLESKQQFADWIKNRIKKYEFIEGQYFEVIHSFMKNPEGGRPLDEYALSIDCAKELSMVEGNMKGKQARKYFIACEKKLKESSQFALPQTFSDALRLAAEQAEKIEQQTQLIESQKPKVLFADAVATSDRSCLIGELAKIMKQNNVDIGQNRLFLWLREKGYLCSKGERYNQPTQSAMDLGLFEIKKTSITKPDGTILVTTTPKVTGKGQIYFVNKLINKN